MLDRDVVRCGMTELILRQAASVAAHVRAMQMKDAHLESFNTINLALDIGDRGHVWAKSSPMFFSAQSLRSSPLPMGEKGQGRGSVSRTLHALTPIPFPNEERGIQPALMTPHVSVLEFK